MSYDVGVNIYTYNQTSQITNINKWSGAGYRSGASSVVSTRAHIHTYIRTFHITSAEWGTVGVYVLQK